VLSSSDETFEFPRWLAFVAVNPFLLGAAAAATSGVGSLGGLGGAIMLVPALVVTGTSAAVAAPLGLISVVAGSVAAAPKQLTERTVNHRIGVLTEVAATSGALAGALLAGSISDSFIARFLAVVAFVAAVGGGRRKGMRNKPDPTLDDSVVGEWIGTTAGAYKLNGGVVPYRLQRLWIGLSAMSLSGLVAGIAGIGGGFIKTPATSEIMKVPVKVAASTTMFTIGITSSAALIVMAVRGQIEPHNGAIVMIGALIGGQLGTRLQGRFSPPVIRRVLSALLIVVSIILMVRG